MSSGFTFGFSGDDIDVNETEEDVTGPAGLGQCGDGEETSTEADSLYGEARKLDLDEMVSLWAVLVVILLCLL